MTTIAYKDGVLAGDSWSTLHGDPTQKIFKLDDGRLVGVSGDLSSAMFFIDFLKDEAEFTGGDFNAIVIYPNGDAYFYGERGFPLTIGRKFMALGTGSAYAMGAMAQGATAEEAVAIAIDMDESSGGNIVVERI